jgi:hypothetical protein
MTGRKRSSLGPGRGSGRLGVVEDLLRRVPVSVELALDGAHALAFDVDAADLGPGLHAGAHPRRTSPAFGSRRDWAPLEDERSQRWRVMHAEITDDAELR